MPVQLRMGSYNGNKFLYVLDDGSFESLREVKTADSAYLTAQITSDYIVGAPASFSNYAPPNPVNQLISSDLIDVFDAIIGNIRHSNSRIDTLVGGFHFASTYSDVYDDKWTINNLDATIGSGTGSFEFIHNRFDVDFANGNRPNFYLQLSTINSACLVNGKIIPKNTPVGYRPHAISMDIRVYGESNISVVYDSTSYYSALTQSQLDNLTEDPVIEDEGPVQGIALSIYTPGGTSGDSHNPYPGGSSGSNPGTNDPLNSGEDTTNPNTDGTWELPFDEVPDSPATVHSVDLGLYNAYALSAMQVKELADYLFSGVTEVGENLVKLIWGSKRDVVISLYEFPLMVTTQGTETIRFIFDTDLAGFFHGKQLTSEYLPIDFGTIPVPRYSGTFYDFEPYTTLTLYIPYIGYIDLKPTEVVGSILSVSGYVHLTTGELNVNVRSSRTGILGSYSGTIGRMLPIADADATDIYSSIIKTAASFGAVALAGAGMASASKVAAGISTPNKQSVDTARDTYMQSVGAWGSARRGVRGLEADMLTKRTSYEQAQSNYAEQSGNYNAAQGAVRANREDFHDSLSDAASNSLDAVTTGFGVSRGTVMTSSNGRVSPQRCFLRIEVPHQSVSRQQKILGYPANSSDSLNSNRLHGYTELRTIELSIPNATLTEIQELEDILRGGFYLP